MSKERREDFTLTLMNYAAERFLYRLAQSKYRDRFVLKGAMLFAVRVGAQYRPTRDLDLLGLGEASEAAVATAVRDIATTKVDDDGVVFDVDGLEVHAICEDTLTPRPLSPGKGCPLRSSIPRHNTVNFSERPLRQLPQADARRWRDGRSAENTRGRSRERADQASGSPNCHRPSNTGFNTR